MNGQVDKILGKLGSNFDGEILNAVNLLREALAREGLSFHQVSLVRTGDGGNRRDQYAIDSLSRQLGEKDQKIRELRQIISELSHALSEVKSIPESSPIIEDAEKDQIPTEVSWPEFKKRCKDVVGGGLGWKRRIAARLDVSRRHLNDLEAGDPIPQPLIAKLWAM